jgi:DNA transposition AAA+ family ATPase
MKDKIILTQNMAGFAGVVENLINKPARMDRIGLIHGSWGLGKTTALEWFYTNNHCFYVRSMAAWSRSVTMMVEDILTAYRVEPRGRLKQDVRELVRVAKKNQAPLFIDEANRVVKKSLLVETIRDVHDFARIPIVLIGQENIINLLKRRDLGPVFSRVSEIYEFQKLSALDIQHISKELCGLAVDIKVASFIRTVCLGDFRLVNALLVRVEELCNLNKVSEITISIAKEAASVMPDREGSDIIIKGGSVEGEALRVANG